MHVLDLMNSDFKYDPADEANLVNELILQVRKVIGPFAAPKKVFIVSDPPKTRSGKVRIFRRYSIRFHILSLNLDYAPYFAENR